MAMEKLSDLLPKLIAELHGFVPETAPSEELQMLLEVAPAVDRARFVLEERFRALVEMEKSGFTRDPEESIEASSSEAA